MGSAALEVLGLHAFLVEQGFSKEPLVVWGESSSALQLAHCWGPGRLKHVASETVGGTVMGLNGTVTVAECAQCGECGRRVDKACPHATHGRHCGAMLGWRASV